MGKRFYLYNLCRPSALVRTPEDRQLRRGLCMNGAPTTEDRQPLRQRTDNSCDSPGKGTKVKKMT